jgi:hypothetical protein
MEFVLEIVLNQLHRMNLVLGLTLGWAFDCGWIEKNPCNRTFNLLILHQQPKTNGFNGFPRILVAINRQI